MGTAAQVLSDARERSKNFSKILGNVVDFARTMLWMRPPMASTLERLLLLASLSALALGCKPEIGDDCQASTDCSAAGDRLCDITAPDGYCTIYNCEPDACPDDEALCVQFGAQRSPLEGCESTSSPSPYARAFCMATCESDDDCRPGYVCGVLDTPNPWGALLIDTNRGNRACLVPASATGLATEPSEGVDPSNVCQAQPAAGADAQSEAGAGTGD